MLVLCLFLATCLSVGAQPYMYITGYVNVNGYSSNANPSCPIYTTVCILTVNGKTYYGCIPASAYISNTVLGTILYYSNGGTLVRMCATGDYQIGSTGTGCGACAAGYIVSSDALSCVACAAGQYELKKHTQCNSCSPGTYITAPGESCNTCMAGQYASGSGSTRCDSCSSTQYSYAGASTCSNCPNGAPCFLCSYGQYSGSTGCQTCPAGTYISTTGVLVTACNVCAAGAYVSYTGASVCTSCDAGTFSSVQGATTCEPCATGSYNGAAAQSTCTLCPVDTYSATTAAIACTSCVAGQYQDQLGQTSCKNCVLPLNAVPEVSTSGSQCPFYCSNGYITIYVNSKAYMCGLQNINPIANVYSSDGVNFYSCPANTYTLQDAPSSSSCRY